MVFPTPFRDVRARFRFTLLSLAAATGLLAWGAFVTSIDAGLAVPDWPTSFSSYDPFNPWPEWWRVTPVLAEHGHRLMGALVGLLTLVLAGWTWMRESRNWLRWLAVGALVLVSLQGLLGGLRVVHVSLDLAVVHACVAQLFFALLAALALFTSRSWPEMDGTADSGDPRVRVLRVAGPAAAVVVYVQIVLGALLRHPGTGIDPTLAILHMSWAFVALAAVVYHAVLIGRTLRRTPGAQAVRLALLLIVLGQVILGFVAYFVLLDEQGMLRPSNLQVVVNSLHLVVGASLFTTNVLGVIIAYRASRAAEARPLSAPSPST